ncbi:MAG: HTTM domain-containing protein, partial [Myxococcota bacterium]
MRLTDPIDKLAGGDIDATAYRALRVGLAVLVLLRITTFGESFFPLDHHGWVDGLEWWSASDVSSPALRFPLWLPVPLRAERALLVLRLGAAVTMLVGLAPRTSSLLVALSGWTLMNADPFRYFHHLHLLYLACALVALCPSGWRLARAPRWPMQLVRLQVLLVYGAAGLGKCNEAWLSGETLTRLHELGLLGTLPDVSFRVLAIAITATELALIPLLAWRRTRWLGIALALVLHAGLDIQMMVSTFGATMILLVSGFLPLWQRPAAPR